MQIEFKTKEEVMNEIQEKYSLDTSFLFHISNGGTVRSGKYECMVCDYRKLTEYKAAYQVAVYKGENSHMVYRVNVKR